MKIFIYKSLIVSFLALLIFQITIGSKINEFKSELSNLSSPQKIAELKLKFFNEIKKANKKDNYFSPEEREDLSIFFKKIQSELSN